MGNLALTQPARTGAVTTGAAVASTDVITRDVLGVNGVNLEIINGNAGADTVTISDASTAPSGGPAAAISKAVAPSTSQIFKIHPSQADQVTGSVTITHSVTATVTYKMYPRS